MDRHLDFLHNVPVLSGCSIGGLLMYTQRASPAVALAAAMFGLLGTAVLHRLLPIPTLAPLDKSHFVGIRHVRANGRVPSLSVFYPTDIEPKLNVAWLPHHDVRYAEGTARYVGLPGWVMHHHKNVDMHATRNAAVNRVIDPVTKQQQRPIIVFSHGLAGHYHAYSSLCMDLAAQGAVVVAVQHRDGSAAFARDEHDDSDFVELRKVPHPDEELAFRESQLQTRIDEVRKTLDVIEDGSLLFESLLCADCSPDVWKSAIRNVSLVGHSFGAATVLGTTAAEWSDRKRRGIKLNSATMLDVWGFPVKNMFMTTFAEPQTNLERLPQLTFIDSDQWQRWKENMDFEQHVLATLGPRATRIWEPNTDHLTASDMGLLTPVLSRRPYKTADDRAIIFKWAKAIFDAARPDASKSHI